MPIIKKHQLTNLKTRLQGRGAIPNLQLNPLTVAGTAMVSGALRAKVGSPDGSWKYPNTDIDVEPVLGLGFLATSVLVPDMKISSLAYNIGAGVMLGYLGNSAWRAARKL